MTPEFTIAAATVTAVALLPGVALWAGRLAFTNWRTTRRRQARVAWQVLRPRPLAELRNVEEV